MISFNRDSNVPVRMHMMSFSCLVSANTSSKRAAADGYDGKNYYQPMEMLKLTLIWSRPFNIEAIRFRTYCQSRTHI